jgi:hypothetical protein
MLSALCFVLCAQNHIFWSKLAAFCSCFVLCAWPCATKRPDFCEQERLPFAALAICYVRMLRAWRAVTKTPDKHKARSTKHKAQSMSTKHEHKAQRNDKKNWALQTWHNRLRQTSCRMSEWDRHEDSLSVCQFAKFIFSLLDGGFTCKRHLPPEKEGNIKGP